MTSPLRVPANRASIYGKASTYGTTPDSSSFAPVSPGGCSAQRAEVSLLPGLRDRCCPEAWRIHLCSGGALLDTQ
ncbi:hypothetical protein F7725_021528 [Dissostichus mawsoni]|uniref:Uncharacterized protein n=1 Tax=Dissostichus mawsoni TaxID=36200 RepID=A0A7J5ZDN5_DISMA|nr:hypothetical protein F7725_021528 [Dissostichus mawsoni]